MSNCPYAGNTWMMSLRCKFEPRYDLSPPDLSQFASIERGMTQSILEQFRTKTYVHDVCVKCGKTTDRSKP